MANCMVGRTEWQLLLLSVSTTQSYRLPGDRPRDTQYCARTIALHCNCFFYVRIRAGSTSTIVPICGTGVLAVYRNLPLSRYCGLNSAIFICAILPANQYLRPTVRGAVALGLVERLCFGAALVTDAVRGRESQLHRPILSALCALPSLSRLLVRYSPRLQRLPKAQPAARSKMLRSPSSLQSARDSPRTNAR